MIRNIITIILGIIMFASFFSKYIITPNLLSNLGSVNPAFYPPIVEFFSALGDYLLVWCACFIISVVINMPYVLK